MRGCAAAGLFLLVAAGAAGAQTSVPRISFVIATGPTGGTYFPVGEAIGSVVTHPPGLFRCDRVGVCGPPGLIASVRTSNGAVANVLAVNAGTVDAALAQSDVVRDAIAGTGAFRKAGPQKHVRVLAVLFPEDLHLIVLKKAHIASIADLADKRVNVGPDSSGTNVTARAVLAAYGLPLTRIHVNGDPSDLAADQLDKGKLDAMFFVGGVPVPLARELLVHGDAKLIAIGGDGRARLLKSSPALESSSIPAGLYPGTGKIDTVALHAVLLVRDSAPEGFIYGVTKALFNPANRATLAGSQRSAQFIRIETAAVNPPALLHPGAARFYAEMGRLPKNKSASR